ncbi:hypothetical protein P280DRAFT_471343 [Massarina eburnea CBS 473.64]|uniref:Amidohydrolase-related domain-containing protein n=1 Tax=Massarina eburnea CBS 473.64 TaxID=1395130 RepID=A0A6A6RU32_9PLEO|nr:hypothetical protein P280DRAFT_471343 [Massarina eburnea CBS 473.64]
MTSGHKLAQRHGVSDYKVTTSSNPVQPTGFVYVETDRYLPSPSPDLSPSDDDGKVMQKLGAWAKEPLNELSYLRRIAEGKPFDEDGHDEFAPTLLSGLVIWAPFYLPDAHFKAYIQIAQSVLGKHSWKKVVGYRYLLQGKGVDGVKEAVSNENFVANIVAVGGQGKAFDFGVDSHRDGVEVVEVLSALVEKIRKTEGGGGVKLVLNHFCKPDLSTPEWPSYSRWSAAMSGLSNDPHVYMKLSGAFNEFAPSPTPSSVQELLTTLTPYFNHLYDTFGAKRLMFASDWPVCNVGGPQGEKDGEERNWSVWRSVVKAWMDGKGLEDEEKEWIWWKTGVEAYGIEGF